MNNHFHQIEKKYRNLMTSEKYNEAQILCEDFLKEKPNCREASKALADVFFAKKLNHKASIVLKNTLNQDKSGNNLDLLISEILSGSENVFSELNKAKEEYQKKPQDEKVLKNYAVVLCDTNFYGEACLVLLELLEVCKNAKDVHEIMSYAIGQLYIEKPEIAKIIAEKWLNNFPENPIAKHISKSILGENITCCSVEYVTNIFDAHAPNFNNLMQKLFYKTPAIIECFLNDIKNDLPLDSNIIDIGCGTGLCGKHFKSIVKRSKLYGLDCSENMLEKARELGLYDELIKDDIINYLSKNKNLFNLIVAADVLVYMGDLENFFDLFFKRLENNGFFIASFELTNTNNTKNYLLQTNGRFQHKQEYIQDQAKKAGFTIVKNEVLEIRKENGYPVKGFIFVCQKKQKAEII